MRFSQRMGLKPVKEIIQEKSIDEDLLNSLWNIVYLFYLKNLPRYRSELDNITGKYITNLWFQFLKEPIDEISNTCSNILEYIKDWFFNSIWYEVYDFIDFTAEFDNDNRQSEFDKMINLVLKREISGYRIINHKLCPITSEEEIKEIQSVIDTTNTPSLHNIKSHFISALEKYSDRKSPDYRNSIKESISAVEAIVGIISGNKKAGLGNALKIIEEKVCLHNALKKGFLSIYGYTSDDDGIRHAHIQDSNCDQEDAKYMLVSCSAFVNYLIVKAVKSGIKIT